MIGRRDVYAVLARHLRQTDFDDDGAPWSATAVYDFACALDAFIYSRNPRLGILVRFFHDR